MAYLLILRRNQDNPLGLPPEEMLERFVSWTRSMHEAGVLKAVERLKPATEAITLKRHDGDLEVGRRHSDSEDVIGYYLLEVVSVDVARRIAEGCPILDVGGSVEIRETEPFQPG